VLIAHITDLHIHSPGALTFGVAPMASNLMACIDHINNVSPKPDLVLVTGDITNTGSIEETKHAAHLLSSLQIPYYVIPGNHDDQKALRTIFDYKHCPSECDKKINYVVELEEFRLIALDSSVAGSPGGEITKEQSQWLDKKLKENISKHTLIFMHHPPINCGVIETDIDGFEGADLLAEIISKYNHIEKILCGHIHLAINSRWCGTVISSAPSMGLHLLLDLTLKRESQFFLDSPTYQLHYLTQKGDLVTHTVPVKSSYDTYLFEENDPKV
jgi:3',5'-cyclic AMP phosphodiesterase CpdA